MGHSADVRGYRFGDYELSLARGCLLRDGVELGLRSQSFRVLVYFLQHPGMLVTKDELVSAIWRDIAVSDNALMQCITDIRKALNDQPREARFIKTLPKLGYRFVAEVVPIVSDSVLDAPAAVQPNLYENTLAPIAAVAEDSASLPQMDPAPMRSLPHHAYAFLRPRIARIAALTVLLVLVAAGIGLWTFHQRSAADNVAASPISNRPTVAIMYFENKTNNQRLNWLSEGLADMMIADLAPSEETNILSREQMHSLFPTKDVPYGISEASARMVGKQSGARTVVLGEFYGDSHDLTLSIAICDGKTGKIRARERAAVKDQQEIVVQANLLSVRLAGDIGLRSVASQTLPDVMTTNVEAYRYYSLGVEKAQKFQNAQAVELLKKAIEFDPHFAMAFARIGYAYAVTDFVPLKGRPYLEKALQLSSNLSPKDRMYVSAWDAIAKGEYGAAINTLHQIIDAYPTESEAYCLLGRLLRSEEKVQEATAVLQRGLESNPNSGNLYNAMGLVMLGQHRYHDAIETEKRYVALSQNDPNAHDSLGMAYEQSGAYIAAVSEYNAALAIDPEFEPSIVHMGDTWFQQGHYREAIQEYQRYIQVSGSDAARAIGYGDLATVYRMMGNLDAAQRAASEEMRHDPTAVWDAIHVALDRKDTAKASSLERSLLAGKLNRERGTQSDIRTQFYDQGYLALRRGDGEGAIANFSIALQHLPATSGIDLHEDCLANAYLELGRWKQAAAEYERVLKLNPNYPLAQFRLAIAYQHLDDAVRSQEAYARFLQEWQSADPELMQKFQLDAKGSAGI